MKEELQSLIRRFLEETRNARTELADPQVGGTYIREPIFQDFIDWLC